MAVFLIFTRDGSTMFDSLKKGEEAYAPKKLKTTTLGDPSRFFIAI